MMNFPLFSRKMTSRSGFTLVELLVVIAIIAVLATVGAGAALSALKTAKRVRAANTATQLQTGIVSYFTEYGVYPIPAGTTDQTGSDNEDLIYALCGNIDPTNPGTPVANGLNSRNIAYLTPIKADLDGKKIKTPFKDLDTGTTQYYKIAMDTDYDNIVLAPDFSTAVVGPPKNITQGVAIWAFCDQKAEGARSSSCVHTY